MIKGISVLNPVDVEKEYLEYTVDYAIEKGFDHFQLIGPIHNYIKGNIDGMLNYRKYSAFNGEKDAGYVYYCMDTVNSALKKAKAHGIKTYMWHHELYLPADFEKKYPEILNDCNDIEITSPRVKDFVENKIYDFFEAYPVMDGIILTLHETQVPLLKLKNQKLTPGERIKYVTKILYDSCKKMGRELIVRTFASIEEDYEIMAKAYEKISSELMIMDKWTQFDWSLTMPGNRFYKKIKNNPLFVEADIFGEFFGKGRVPLMLKNHIKKQFAHCSSFNPAGYVARIDRNGQIPFGDVNEVNLNIMKAYLDGADPEPVIDGFFEKKYPGAAKEVRNLMENTEEILTKTIYIKNYLFSELSLFPSLNHCKNHFYFEMMKRDAKIVSGEWFIPTDWQGCNKEEIIKDKEYARKEAAALLTELEKLKDRIEKTEYEKLYVKFSNLALVTEAWYHLLCAHINYVKYFEEWDEKFECLFFDDINALKEIAKKGDKLLKEKFYCMNGDKGRNDYIGSFISDITESFRIEKELTEALKREKLTDFIICGGAMEGHELKKEVNFSDTFVKDNSLSRIPGNRHGANWSKANNHGWFSYLLKVKPNSENEIRITADNPEGEISFVVSVNDKEYKIEKKSEKREEFVISFKNDSPAESIRLRIDRNSPHTPYIHLIKTI